MSHKDLIRKYKVADVSINREVKQILASEHGKADHLIGLTLPDTKLISTGNEEINLATYARILIIFCYPDVETEHDNPAEDWAGTSSSGGYFSQMRGFKDYYSAIKQLDADILGISTQGTKKQRAVAKELDLPYKLLSDSQLVFKNILKLPFFVVDAVSHYKRITLIAINSEIRSVHYPISLSYSDPVWVIDQLKGLTKK